MNPNHKPSQHRSGVAKPLIIIGLVAIIAVLVPLALYIVANIAFPNGTTTSNLTVPDTGVVAHTPPPAPAAAATPAAVAPTAPRPNRRVVANKTPSKIMDLLVIDHETKQPISGITIESFGRRVRFNGTTGADGHARVPSPIGPITDNFQVRVTGKGYIPMRLEWASYRPEFQGAVPDAFTMEMGRSTKVSGKIIDDTGQPVAGANVYVEFTKKYADPHQQVDLSPYNQNQQIRSGEDGSWTFNGAPLNCDEIGLTAWDTKHVTGDYWSPQPFSPVSKLYDGTATFTLHTGITVDGIVLDPQGSPLAGASVGLGQQRQTSNSIPARNTDPSGHFAYQFDPGQQVILTIMARGCAPEMQQFTMGQKKQSLTIHMTRPHHISGKIVNASGNPVRNANIYLNSWRGFQTIEANFQTNAAGEFHWNEAPADPITVRVDAPNLRGVNEQVLQPDRENLIKLSPISHVHGIVTDAQTGQPIDDYQLTFGIIWPNNPTVTWQPGWHPETDPTAGGKFQITDNFPYSGIAFQISAPGYMPIESRTVKPDEGDVTLEFKMKPAKDIVLTIHGPDGKPLEGATAVIAIPGQQVQILNGNEVQYSNGPQQKSGPDGHIDFSPQAGPYQIAIFADAGSAQVDRADAEKSADVTLTPWGTIQGRMMIGPKPAVGLDIDAYTNQNIPYSPNTPRIFDQHSVKTDEDGRFVFEHLSPGNWTISRRIHITANFWNNATLQNVDLSPGQTVSIAVGGKGRPVIGKVILPPEITGRSDWSYWICEISTTMNNPGLALPMPPDIRNASPQKRQQWMQTWMQSDASKTWRAAQQKAMAGRREYPFTVAADGSFRAEDVLAGTYEITIDIRANNGLNGQGEMIGTGREQLIVPQMPAGRSDDPLQIDPITVVKIGKYQIGDSVYDLPMQSTDGKNLKLSDFRGKYVLLDFRSLINNSNIPQLKAVHNAYAGDRRFVMLTLVMNSAHSLRFKLPDIAWQQAVPEGMARTILQTNFAAAKSPPSDWLIGPNGKMVAEDLSGDAIMPAITAALGPPITQPAIQPTTAP